MLSIIATAISLSACTTSPSNTTPSSEPTTIVNESDITTADSWESSDPIASPDPMDSVDTDTSADTMDSTDTVASVDPTDCAVIKDIETSAEETAASIEEGMVNVDLAEVVEFQDGYSEGDLEFVNIHGSHYIFRVILKRNDTDTVLFRSGDVKPGQTLTKFKLNDVLEKGDYECNAVITFTDPESLELIGEAEVLVMLKVLN